MEKNKHSCTEVLGVEVENKLIRRFLRSLAALAIMFVLVLSGHSRVVNGDWNFTNNDAIVVGLSLGLLLTIEGVKAFLAKKLK